MSTSISQTLRCRFLSLLSNHLFKTQIVNSKDKREQQQTDTIIMSVICVFIQVLKISLIGHRKRILASLGDRLHEDTPQKPPRAISLRVRVFNKWKLVSIHQTEVVSRSLPGHGCVLYRLPLLLLVSLVITKISKTGTKWPPHCSLLPTSLS